MTEIKGTESPLPEWLQQQLAIRAAEDMAERRAAYDAWALAYSDCGVRKPDADEKR